MHISVCVHMYTITKTVASNQSCLSPTGDCCFEYFISGCEKKPSRRQTAERSHLSALVTLVLLPRLTSNRSQTRLKPRLDFKTMFCQPWWLVTFQRKTSSTYKWRAVKTNWGCQIFKKISDHWDMWHKMWNEIISNASATLQKAVVQTKTKG